MTAIKSFFAAAPGAIKRYLNVTELLRIAILAALAGGGVGAILPALLQNVAQIVVSPADTTLVASLLTAAIEIVRRLGQGKDPNVIELPEDRSIWHP